MNSFLIVGGSKVEREEKAKNLAGDVHPIDTTTLVPDPAIGIEQIRELKKNFSLKPIKSKQKVAFVIEAQKMTVAAQNAPLKTLEEPPGETLLILTSPDPDLLLPTISSRCQIINLTIKPEIKPEMEDLLKHWRVLKQLFSGGVGERLLLSEKIAKNREEAIEWLKIQMILWRQILLFVTDCTQILSTDFADKIKVLTKHLSTKQILKTLKNIEQTKKMLEQNVHVRLAMDNLLLEYPTLSQPD